MTSIRNLTSPTRYPRFMINLARRVVVSRLNSIAVGELLVTDHSSGQSPLVFGTRASSDIRATIEVLDEQFWPNLMLQGSVGAAESYTFGHWKADNLTALVRLMILNRSSLNALEGGLAIFSELFRQWFHRRNRNVREGAAENIKAHYDLGNDFFSLMLDSTMAYSSAVFPTPSADLEAAQLHKFKLIADQLALRPDLKVAEIGSGWGGLAIYIAQQYGCHVTSITLSPSQLKYAKAKAQQLGVGDKVNFQLCDYRDLQGTFDRVVSIEMIEAVGAEFLGTYVERLSNLLNPHGRAVIQMIAIQDQFYEQALRSVDFIQKYIFPGSFIPSLTAFQNALTHYTDCRIIGIRDIGLDYAKTLKVWRENVFAQREKLHTLGYDDRFLRLWEYYLCYCEGGFLERQLGDLQITFIKPHHRDP
jgi:cyclopropane-fatty-acyl-phospholipid synthase